MPFAPFACWSTGVATDCSTVRASAPVYVAVVWIWGGAISGNCAIGSRKIMTAPAIIVRIARTCATIGCSMKNLDTGVLSPHRGRRGWGCGGRVRFRTDGDTVLHLLQSLRHDAFAWLEPLVDDPEPVHLLARLHGAERDLVVRSDDGDLVHALGLLHRTLRYDEGTMERLRGGAYLGVEAGAKDGVGIREEGLHQDRPRLLIDLAVRDVEPAGTGSSSSCLVAAPCAASGLYFPRSSWFFRRVACCCARSPSAWSRAALYGRSSISKRSSSAFTYAPSW